MCIETQSLATALLPKFASDVGYDVFLMQLLSAYQKNPGTETYKRVQDYLLDQRLKKQLTLNLFNEDKVFKRIDLNILDYEDNLLWSTAPLENQDKIVLLYQASEYSSEATHGSAYKKFEDGSQYSLAWVSGSPLFLKGGALRIGTTLSNSSDTKQMDPSGNLTVTTTGNPTIGTWTDACGNWTTYTFYSSGTFYDGEKQY